MFKQEKNLNVQNVRASTVQAQRYFEKNQLIRTNFMLVENNASVVLFWLTADTFPRQRGNSPKATDSEVYFSRWLFSLYLRNHLSYLWGSRQHYKPAGCNFQLAANKHRVSQQNSLEVFFGIAAVQRHICTECIWWPNKRVIPFLLE